MVPKIGIAKQLQRTVSALSKVIQRQFEQGLVLPSNTDLWSAMALVYSTLLALYKHHSHLNTNFNPFIGHNEVRSLRSRVCQPQHRTLQGILSFKAWLTPDRLPAASVFVCDCLFPAGTSCVWHGGESGDHEAAVVLADIRYLGCNRGEVGSGSEYA